MDVRPAHHRPGPPAHRGRAAAFLPLLLLLGAAGLTGCGPSEGGGAAAHQAAARDAEWAWIQKAKQDLDRKRAQGGDPDGTARQADELGRRLVAFINADPPAAGEPLTERQQAAIRLKSDEDMRLAREAIDRGGDYQRAIALYENALAVDPDNAELQKALEQARARRYMTRELFSQVKEGMQETQVRSLLGQPNLHDVRDYPERGVVAWFYPKDASGAAAGVWFEKKGGAATVYLLDFDAIAPQPEEAPSAAPATGVS